MRNRVSQTVQRQNSLTRRFLRSETQSTAQRFLYVPLSDFGCPPRGLVGLLGFGLLQSVACAQRITRLLQNVPKVLQKVTPKKIRNCCLKAAM